MSCKQCQAPVRLVWPPEVHGRPAFNKVEQRGWFALAECSMCGSLWVDAPYEPYASFVYSVFLPHSKAEWSQIGDLQDGQIISSWCDAEMRLAFE
jgi:hypothetical protein